MFFNTTNSAVSVILNKPVLSTACLSASLTGIPAWGTPRCPENSVHRLSYKGESLVRNPKNVSPKFIFAAHL